MGLTELIKDRYLVPGNMRAPAGSPEGQRPPIGDVIANTLPPSHNL